MAQTEKLILVELTFCCETRSQTCGNRSLMLFLFYYVFLLRLLTWKVTGISNFFKAKTFFFTLLISPLKEKDSENTGSLSTKE